MHVGILLYHIHEGQRITQQMLKNNLVIEMTPFAGMYGGAVRVARCEEGTGHGTMAGASPSP